MGGLRSLVRELRHQRNVAPLKNQSKARHDRYHNNLGDNWQQWNYTWEEQLARVLNKTGVNAVILEMSVTHDPANSSRSVIEVSSRTYMY